MSEESFVYTACPGWGDHDYCAIKTIVKDGRIVRTEKVVYSEPEKLDGHICQKGILACRQPYNPKRLTKPLKRVGERGAGQWEEIGWDQALDEIAAKMQQIKDESGPQAIAFWALAAGVPPSQGLGTLLNMRFTGLWGATDPIYGIGLDNGPLFANFYTFGNVFVYALQDPQIFVGADVFIIWGSNPIENQMRGAMNLVRAREQGTYFIDVGLVFDGSAGWADEFVGVAAGSDAWLALAMSRHIIDADLIDRDFLIQHSVASYLVRDDDGKMLRDAFGNYLVWDESSGTAVAVGPANAAIEAKQPALLGSYTVDGVATKTAYQKLIEFLAEYTPEAAEAVTKVPAAETRRLAELYAKADKAFIQAALGMRYANQGSTYRAIQLLAILTGNMGDNGKGISLCSQFMSYPFELNDKPITMPLGIDGPRSQPVMMEQFFVDASSDNSPYRGFFSIAGNPVHQQPDRNRWLKMFNQMDLVVDFDIWLTDTGELADYVLPDCMPFERLEIITAAQYNHVVLQEPAIEPPPEVHNANYLFSGLARRLGLGEYFDKTDEEWLAIRLESEDPSITTLEPKLTFERLKAEKMVRTNVPAEPKFDPYRGLQFMSPSGRAEFYVERLADIGFALPKYTPTWECPVIDSNGKYPYQLFTGRQRFFMQSMYTDDPINVELSGGEPYTRINPKDAAAKGLLDGAKVEVFNDRGHVVTKLELDESVPPGTLHVWFGWRRKQFEEGTYSELVTPICAPGIADDVSRRWLDDWQAAGGIWYNPLDMIATEIGSWDAYWDVACDIRLYKSVEQGKGA